MVINRTKDMVLKCSLCGKDFCARVNIFHIGRNSSYEVLCPSCGEKVLRITCLSDGFLNVEVSCFICNTPHSYRLSGASFWQDELYALPCSSVGMDICFVGEREKAENAMKSLNDSIQEIQARFEDEIAKNNDACMVSALNHMYDLVVDNKILCINGDGEIKIEARESGIKVSCRSCGAAEYIPVRNKAELKRFLSRKSIVLLNGNESGNGGRKKRSRSAE